MDQRAVLFTDFALYNRMIYFDDRMRAELLRQPRGTFGRLSKQHNSRYRPIQPMENAQKRIAWLLIPLFDELFYLPI